MTKQPSGLQISTSGSVVSAAGEVDAHSSRELAGTVRPIVEMSETTLDLAEITFMDASGIRVLIEAHQIAAAQGHRFIVRRPTAPVRRILELTGLGDVFEIVE